MKLKIYKHYMIDFRSKWLMPSALLMGLSFFLRIVYYFGLTNLSTCSFGEVIFFMILPLLICSGYVVAMSALKLNAPVIYGMLGAGLCLLMVFWSFPTGDVLRIILSILIYVAAGTVLLATTGGYLPGKLLSSVLFALPLVCRFLFYRGGIGILDWFLEISVLSLLVSLFCLTRCLKERKHKA